MKKNIKNKYVILKNWLSGVNISSGIKLGNLLQFKSPLTGFKNDVMVSDIEELERIIEYREEYKEKAYNHLINICIEEFGFEIWKEDLSKFACAEYKLNNGNFWIAVNEKDEVIGTIGLRNIDNETGQLKVFYVNKKYRGKGLAKKLFDICMNFVEEKKYKEIVLCTVEKFDRARSFYKKNGFEEIERNGETYTYRYIVEKNIVETENNFIECNVS